MDGFAGICVQAVISSEVLVKPLIDRCGICLGDATSCGASNLLRSHAGNGNFLSMPMRYYSGALRRGCRAQQSTTALRSRYCTSPECFVCSRDSAGSARCVQPHPQCVHVSTRSLSTTSLQDNFAGLKTRILLRSASPSSPPTCFGGVARVALTACSGIVVERNGSIKRADAPAVCKPFGRALLAPGLQRGLRADSRTFLLSFFCNNTAHTSSHLIPSKQRSLPGTRPSRPSSRPALLAAQPHQSTLPSRSRASLPSNVYLAHLG